MSASTNNGPILVSTGLVVVSVVFPLLSGFSMYGRFKARRISKQPLKADDWWLVASWFFTFALSIVVWNCAREAGVNHYKINPSKGLEDSLLNFVVAAAIHPIAVSIVKIGILFFYQRLFPTRKFKFATYIFMACVSCWGIIFFFLMLFQSDPITGSWTGEGHLRFNSYALGMAEAVMSVGFDIIILAFPIPMIAHLNMRLRRKIAVTFIFWLGMFCVVAAAVRIYLVDATVKQVIQSKSFDAVYLQTTQFMFVMIEPNCSIIAANLPTYGPLLKAGRAPELIIRSARALSSLRSGTSSVDKTRYDSRSSSTPSDTTFAVGGDLETHSEHEMKGGMRDFTNAKSRNYATVIAGPQAIGSNETTTGGHDDQIMVTRGVEVTRLSRES